MTEEVEKFEVHKLHKMSDYVENIVTEWAFDLVTEHFGCDVGELTMAQLEEVIEEYGVIDEYDSFLAMGFRNVISTWENQNGEYVL